MKVACDTHSAPNLRRIVCRGLGVLVPGGRADRRAAAPLGRRRRTTAPLRRAAKRGAAGTDRGRKAGRV